jgi:hypothetical protein
MKPFQLARCLPLIVSLALIGACSAESPDEPGSMSGDGGSPDLGRDLAARDSLDVAEVAAVGDVAGAGETAAMDLAADTVPGVDVPGVDVPGADASAMLDAVPGADSSPEVPAAAHLPGIAIVSSNKSQTSMALSLAPLDATAVEKDECLHSGTVSAKLTTALSGDVDLPTAEQPLHEIALIDRMNATVTWVAPESCEVLRQMSVGAGLAPYDVIAGLPGGKAYVTRHARNPSNANEGGDILIIDIASAVAKGRIDLSASVSATTPPAKPLLPFPTRGLFLNGKVYVVLGHMSEDLTVAGVGRVVVIDPNTDTVTGTIDLPGVENCGVIKPVEGPGDGPQFITSCGGMDSETMGSSPKTGLPLVDVGMTPPKVTVYLASTSPVDNPASATEVSGLGPGHGVKVSQSSPVGGARMRQFGHVVEFSFTPAGYESSHIYSANQFGSHLSVTYDPGTRRLYVLINSWFDEQPFGLNGVHVFDGTKINGPSSETAFFPSNPAHARAPRRLMVY